MEKFNKFNRIRVVLAEKEISNKWLADQLGKAEMTVSRWCTNKSQPTMAQLFEIADVLDVCPSDLIENGDRQKIISVK